MRATDRLRELKEAADEYFAAERKRLHAEHAFLDIIAKRRGAGLSLQDANATEAAQLLEASINDYLGRPL